jgi:hypothetical protein
MEVLVDQKSAFAGSHMTDSSAAATATTTREGLDMIIPFEGHRSSSLQARARERATVSKAIEITTKQSRNYSRRDQRIAGHLSYQLAASTGNLMTHGLPNASLGVV